MKLLYISSYHATLDYDDLSLFTEMGIDWFSTGAYLDPKNPKFTGSWSRPAIQKDVDLKLLTDFLTLNPFHRQYSNILLTKQFVDNFDVILCNFSFCNQTTLDDIWEACKHKTVIFRTYSQQFSDFEHKLSQYRSQGLKLVRGSRRESTIGNYAGEDAIIRCYVDESKYIGWIGTSPTVVTFSNDFSARLNHVNFECYRLYCKYIKPNCPCHLFGRDTEVVGGKGFISDEEQVKQYRENMVYFNIGSPPATVTYNFLEAWATGIPVVTFGSKLGNGVGFNTHEPPHLITKGKDGFFSDDINELVEFIHYLLNNKKEAEAIGAAGRLRCIKEFSKQSVKDEWQSFFTSLGVL
jgi:hypothetical protein